MLFKKIEGNVLEVIRDCHHVWFGWWKKKKKINTRRFMRYVKNVILNGRLFLNTVIDLKN